MSSHQPIPPGSDTPLTDRHIVETPEQIQLQFAVAGIGSRFLAIAIDTLIQGLIGVVIVIAFALFSTTLRQRFPMTRLWAIAGLIAFLFLLYYGYFAFFEILWSGQTSGKRVIGVRVMKETGRPLTPAESIGRNLLRIVDQLPGFYAVGVVAAMMNAQSKRLGDFLAGSIVVREKSLAEVNLPWENAPASTASLGAVNRLTPEEIVLIDAFLARRHDLSPDVRACIASEILRRIESKLTLTDEHRASAEWTLKLLANEYRSAQY